MNNNPTYDAGIIGGGLAGLSLAIQLARANYSVALFEKETYPYHKVCGEYISMESWDFIEKLGIPLPLMNLPIIKKVQISAPNGNMLQHELPLGGFGISRFLLDNELKKIAIAQGVTVYENCKVTDAHFNGQLFEVTTNKDNYTCEICFGSFGKRSNLDIKWKREFAVQRTNKQNNYIGIKYHIKTNFANDTIALHNFKGGYCGLSKIENDKFCLCYLTHAAALQSQGSIAALEKNILSQNPHLRHIFSTSEFLFDAPVSIAQISFAPKKQLVNHLLMVGDAAGMVTPLCGNGMSMALHGSKIAAENVMLFLQKKTSRLQMEKDYVAQWKNQFANRLLVGRLLQQNFGKEWLTNSFIGIMKKMPAATEWLIRQTHGKPF